MPEPKPCCHKPPLMFYDTKAGADQEMIVLCCPICGKYVDDFKKDSLVKRWNGGEARTYSHHQETQKREPRYKKRPSRIES